jgi:DNA sulfur modification protein DndE
MIEPPVDRVRLSQTAKDQLSKLKRQTRIDRWNVLCRWAVCRSLAEPSPPSPVKLVMDSNVEMTWRVFAGDDGDAYAIALKQRCHQDNLPTDPETLAQQFLLHLHRGIGYLAGDRNLKQIEDFVSLVKS